jgi:hypothetical protein
VGRTLKGRVIRRLADETGSRLHTIDKNDIRVHTSTAILTGGEKMPEKFKALATINAWVLFVLGWLVLLIGVLIMPSINGVLFAGTAPPPLFWVALASAIMILTLSVVLMKLRQMLE